jgi:hypothetical protein
LGGVVPFPDEIMSEIQRLTKEKLSLESNPRAEWFERMLAEKN